VIIERRCIHRHGAIRHVRPLPGHRAGKPVRDGRALSAIGGNRGALVKAVAARYDETMAHSRPPHSPQASSHRPGKDPRRHDKPPLKPALRDGTRPAPRPGRVAESAGARGGIWLYGLHAVRAALANPQRRVRRLMVTEEAEAALAERLPPPWPISPERVERARIDQLLGRHIAHQGVALLTDPLTVPPLAQVLERPGPILVLDQVTDPRNVGAILRSAAAFGAAAVIMQDRHAPEEAGALAKAASGALEMVPLMHAVNLARTLVALKAEGLWTVGLVPGAPALVGAEYAARRVALVLGAEDVGLRRLLRETCDELRGLAVSGAMESLNVAAAAAIALYELARR
jgi:23S rRNA (guanosine2251-2'-O)-methyltransferase